MKICSLLDGSVIVFHKIAQYAENAGNPERQPFGPHVLFNFAQILHANSHPGEKKLCQSFRRIGQVFLELPV